MGAHRELKRLQFPLEPKGASRDTQQRRIKGTPSAEWGQGHCSNSAFLGVDPHPDRHSQPLKLQLIGREKRRILTYARGSSHSNQWRAFVFAGHDLSCQKRPPSSSLGQWEKPSASRPLRIALTSEGCEHGWKVG